MPIIGAVETSDSYIVTGWAVNPDEPSLPVALDVLLGSTVIDRILARHYRLDLLQAGYGLGFHGFAYQTTKEVDGRWLAFRPTGATSSLAGSWCIRRLNGCVDRCAGGIVSGWVRDMDVPLALLEVEILVDSIPCARCIAKSSRPDVAAAYGGPDTAGFAITIPHAIVGSHVQVRETSSGLTIGGQEVVQDEAPMTVGSFDGLSGSIAAGWAYDTQSPDGGAEIEFFASGELIGSTVASLYREDVEAAGFGNGKSGFRAELDLDLRQVGALKVEARLRRTGQELNNSPIKFDLPQAAKRWIGRCARAKAPVLERLRRWCDHKIGQLRLTIVMTVYETPEAWLREALDSVLSQWASNWELVCVDDASPSPHVAAVLDEYSRRDNRIIVLWQATNQGIAHATNAGLSVAGGDYVVLMDHDDVLEPDAVYWLLKAASQGADLVYTDEIITGESSLSLVQLCARPSFSYDYYLSHPYFVHLVCIRRSLADRLGGWDETMSISGDVDFVLRALELADTVAHVAAPLYRWRTHGGSVGHARQQDVTGATQNALGQHLRSIGVNADVCPGPTFNQYRTNWPDDGGRVLVIVPTKNLVSLLAACIASLLATTRPGEVRLVVIDHQSTDPETVNYLAGLDGIAEVMSYVGPFNYSAMNNEAVRRYSEGSPYVLLLNNDVEALERGWLERMRSIASRPDVGAVGATLLYADGTVQHSGVVISLNGAADHAHKFQPFLDTDGNRNPGYLGSLVSVRDYSAITAACLMMRSEVFARIGGFDDTLAVGFNDTDLCLRIREADLKVLVDPFVVLRHHESATRSVTRHMKHPEDTARFAARWERYTVEGDPFYSPLLTLRGSDHTLSEARGPGPVVRLTKVVRPRIAGALL